MTAPWEAVLWQIWKAWRWGFLLGATYLVAAVILVQFLPEILPHTRMGIGMLPDAGRHLAMPCAFVLIHLIAAFTLIGADDLKERGFAARMFVLPIDTTTLVGGPMILGALAVAGVWWIVAALILRPTGTLAPLWWPAAWLALLLATLQGLSWLPLTQKWFGIFLAVPAILLVGLTAAIVPAFRVPEPLAAGAFAAMLPLAFVVNRHNVAVARRGDYYESRLWERLAAREFSWLQGTDRSFKSTAWAQLWFECRCHGWTLPVFAAAFSVVVAAMMLLHGGDVNSALRLGASLLFMPAMMAMCLGSQYGNVSFPFLATRPISSAAIVRSKFHMALVSAVASQVPTWLVLALYFLYAGIDESLLARARDLGPLKTTLLLTLGVLAPVLMTWKAICESLWIGLLGRTWITTAISLAVAMLLGAGLFLGLWVWTDADLQQQLRHFLPWLLATCVVAKLLGVVGLLLRLRYHDVEAFQAAARFALAWVAIAAGLVLFGSWLVPADQLPTSTLCAGVILSLPICRIIGCSLALDANRSR